MADLSHLFSLKAANLEALYEDVAVSFVAISACAFLERQDRLDRHRRDAVLVQIHQRLQLDPGRDGRQVIERLGLGETGERARRGVHFDRSARR